MKKNIFLNGRRIFSNDQNGKYSARSWALLKIIPGINNAQDVEIFLTISGFMDLKDIDQMVSAQADPFWNKFES